jgi:hypothetical protein
MEPQRIKVHWSFVGKNNEEGFRYSRGNPATKSQLELIPFDLLNPITISGFIKYLWIKKAQTNEHIRLMGLRLSTMPLGVLAKPWHKKAIGSFMSNQSKYSVYYHQYMQYIESF